jgi:hypothetical protein
MDEDDLPDLGENLYGFESETLAQTGADGTTYWELQWRPVGGPSGRSPLIYNMSIDLRDHLEKVGFLDPNKYVTKAQIGEEIARG